jgi:cytochrome c biogenesis protein CcmG, thiol:disulfide interchange protein DsbE
MRSQSFRVAVLSIALAAPALAQTTPPAVTPPAPVTAAPASPSATTRLISSIRNKLSAGDLLSAESLVDVYRETHADDGAYLQGLAWVARGAVLLGDYDRAERYVAEVRRRCDARLARGVRLDADDSLETALGAAIEVEAQIRAQSEGKSSAVRFLETELMKVPGPVALRSRINKRLDMLTLAGTAAPELVVEDYVGDVPPTLAFLRGRPVLLFIWAEGCGDCRAQEASLARVKTKYHDQGLKVLALTRYFDPGDHAVEKARVDSVWTTAYASMGKVPIIISTASMERYGGSSTPTFVTIDRAGLVKWYTPTRLTEAELDRAVAEIMEKR